MAPDMWCVAEEIESCREFGGEEVGRGSAIFAPPLVDGADLRISFRCGSDRQAHCRRRSSSRISWAGRRLPASADFQDAESASCKACRSSLVRSSPSSSATRSTIVPSGKVVGSSRTRRPFSTRARRGLIPPTLRDSQGGRQDFRRRRCARQFRGHIPRAEFGFQSGGLPTRNCCGRLSLVRLHTDPVVDGAAQLLLASQVTLCGLDRDVPE